MSQFGIFLYCAAMGFVAAATISHFYQWVTSERADFSIKRQGVSGLLIAVVISMFAGPFIVSRKILAGVRSHNLKALPAAMGVLVAGVWSVCAGIFFVGLLVSA